MAYQIILRIAISQCILFTVLCYIFIGVGFTATTETFVHYHIERNTCYVTAGFFIVPLTFSAVLLLGVLKENLFLVRIWILMSIFNTIVLACLLLITSIRASKYVPILWGVLLNLLPILLIGWMSDNTVLVIEYYKQKENARMQKTILSTIIFV